MRGAKPCPACGFLLRYEDPPGSPAEALRFVATQLLQWAALALFLAWLWSPEGEGEAYAFLSFLVILAWFGLRRRARDLGEAQLARRQYQCGRCGRRYAGADLRADGA